MTSRIRDSCIKMGSGVSHFGVPFSVAEHKEVTDKMSVVKPKILKDYHLW